MDRVMYANSFARKSPSKAIVSRNKRHRGGDVEKASIGEVALERGGRGTAKRERGTSAQLTQIHTCV